MSAKEIVASLRALAADPANRSQIVRENSCLPGLVVFLQDKDSDVVFTAIEVVYFLSLHLTNRPLMAAEPGMVKAVKRLMVTGSIKEKKIAIAAYTNLQAHATTAKASASNSSEPVTYTEENSQPEAQAEPTQAPPKSTNKQFSSAAQPRPLQARPGLFGESVRSKSAHTFTVYVSGMSTEETRDQVEKVLIKVKGVVSFFFDLGEQKVVVRSMTGVDDIIERIATNGFKASTTKKDVGQAIEINKENEPAYLDESKQENAAGGSWFGGFGTMTLFGAEKEKPQVAAGGPGLLSKLKFW